MISLRGTSLAVCAALILSAACTSDPADLNQAMTPSTNAAVTSTSTSTTDTTTSTTEPAPESPLPTTPRPDWLGVRTIPTDGDGNGRAIDTPPELLDRRFATVDTLPPPTDEQFDYTLVALSQSPEALVRSTWVEGCPVPPEELAYVTVPFWGFDGWVHTGELIVHHDVAEDIVGVFEKLFEARFPIEEMRIVTQADLDAPPIGDTNNSASFVCRPVTGGTRFSEHAKGLAIDINPFHNPYVKDNRILPEQATAYADRSRNQPGLIGPDSVAVQAFADIGWTWGGDWNSLKDYQHFSASGR